MSPLIHRSLTWTIVGTVVSLSTWLAGNVQQAHERQGLRLGVAAPHPAMAVPAATRTPHVMSRAAVQSDTEAPVQLASNR
ncbi:hypothetical protein [Roseateles terrae]|uniref:Secreted protein n=1 Tax=Roseateles terrae TaxID=431060 RepID=A0ABR6GS21_9BURK|nr:hypothetical protein [Roseateles terrae]MBB3194912.1 hypothetical protein [Roseateles terrae]